MAILFISHKYPPSKGGMENQSYELINGFIKKGHKVYSIVYSGEENKMFFFLKLRSKVKLILENDDQIKMVHFNDGLMATFAVSLGVDFRGLPLTATFHGLDVLFPLGIYQKYLLPFLAKKLNKIICVSEATKHACLERNIEENKLVVVNNGINDVNSHAIESEYSSYFKKKYKIDIDKDKIILAIGRPVKRKGFSWFAEKVMPLVGNDFKFVHIGHVPDSESLFKKVFTVEKIRLYRLFVGYPDDAFSLKKLSNLKPDKIILLGNLSDDKKEYLIRFAKVIVMPNIPVKGDMEGFGLVALEASLNGKMVLGSDIEGIRDAIHPGKNGFLIPAGNTWAWTRNILEKSEGDFPDPESIRNYTMQNFNWEKMVAGYSGVFSDIVNDYKSCRNPVSVSNP